MPFDPVHAVLAPLMRFARALHGASRSGRLAWLDEEHDSYRDARRHADFQDTVPRIRYLPSACKTGRRGPFGIG